MQLKKFSSFTENLGDTTVNKQRDITVNKQRDIFHFYVMEEAQTLLVIFTFYVKAGGWSMEHVDHCSDH